ncbi:hypothetical protein GZ77_08015 [Endozoicomonas montiporae]|uniref:Uncharacterized protein n=2 Tax=Endozoicomonas montiporae TaxID=1027273 RepID=A0A081N7B3_9GAMM|nr:hypothetical protein [Endozoicomonas montiporae]AMO55833.1 hypothetical protein EZMO1_1684 [Endozoicomonas montiporae CL-33]KEQ14336.1 hypothetical protein GZ77_08015 [Endozoicomonas montiporae]
MTEEELVNDLIERLKPHLPMFVTPGKSMISQFRSNDQTSVKIKKGMKLKITNCHYIGSEGGLALACEISTPTGKQVVIMSITQLRLDPKHPLYKELRAYQLGRSQWLAMNHRSPVLHTLTR